MVGRPVELTIEKGPASPSEVVLAVDGVTVVDDDGVVVVDDVSFSVRGGEIFALAGVQGNGQTELTQALVGLVIPKSGRIEVEGQDVTELGTNDVLDARRRLCARGPPARRAGRAVLDRREPDPRPLRPAAVRPRAWR